MPPRHRQSVALSNELEWIANLNALPLAKLTWAFTVGLFVGERGDRTDINFRHFCRRPALNGIALSTIMTTKLHRSLCIHERQIRQRIRKYFHQIDHLIGQCFIDSTGARSCITRFSKLLAANHKHHWHNYLQLIALKDAVYCLPTQSPPYCNPSKHQVSLWRTIQNHRLPPLNISIEHQESEMPFHAKKLRLKEWNKDANTPASVIPSGAAYFNPVLWDCCSQSTAIELNSKLAHCMRMRGKREAQCIKQECITTLARWIDNHFDTNNLLMLVAFLLGQLMCQHNLSTLDLSQLYLFSSEEEIDATTLSMLRGGGCIKQHFMDLIKDQLFPLLTFPDLINVFSFCQELRFALMSHTICSTTSDLIFTYYCSYLNAGIDKEPRSDNTLLEYSLASILHYDVKPGLKVWRDGRL